MKLDKRGGWVLFEGMGVSGGEVSELSDEEVALVAYRIWLQEGCPHRRDKEHWQRAREQLLAERAREARAAEQAEG